jgi:hypothetical protein
VSIVLSTEEIEALPPHALHDWWQKAQREHWAHMVMHPDRIQSFRALDTHEAPPEPGIYMLFGADGGLDYVGKSKEISKRLREHLMGMVDGRRPPYSRFAWLQLPSYAYHDIEVAHIYAMEPPHNQLYEPPRWGRHKELVGLVQEAWGYKE